MSLRSVQRTLVQHARDRAADLAAHARATAIASAAKWDKKANEQFKKMLAALDRIADPRPPKRASVSQLIEFFSAIGVPPAPAKP